MVAVASALEKQTARQTIPATACHGHCIIIFGSCIQTGPPGARHKPQKSFCHHPRLPLTNHSNLHVQVAGNSPRNLPQQVGNVSSTYWTAARKQALPLEDVAASCPHPRGWRTQCPSVTPRGQRQRCAAWPSSFHSQAGTGTLV